jgi:hypothetical protein
MQLTRFQSTLAMIGPKRPIKRQWWQMRPDWRAKALYPSTFLIDENQAITAHRRT